MSSVLDRIAQIQKTAIPARLQKGADVLGRLWQAGHHCSWSAACACGAPNDFCRAKAKWFALLQETHPEVDFSSTSKDPWFLVEVMLVEGYWSATGLTAHVRMPGAGQPIKVGPKGTHSDTIFELAGLPEPDRASALEAVTKIQAVGL
jgi:hypothetical protein